MRFILIIFLLFTFTSKPVLSLNEIPTVNSKLPPCNNKQTEYRDNCFGTYIYADNTKWRGDKYIGEFRDGRFNGFGKWIYGPHSPYAGSYYVGEFKDDELHGRGVFVEPNGNKYVGEFKNDLYNGQGTQTWSNGDKYTGQWKDDLQHGLGTYIWSDGRKYTGEWHEDKQNGEGTFFYKNGDRYVGNWLNNLKHGYGIYYYSNGEKYSGDFLNGNKNGSGIFTKINGEVVVGKWKDDVRIYTENFTKPKVLPKIKSEENRSFIAILIANQDYKYMNKLKTPISDITELEKVLKLRYNFQTYIIKNKTRSEFISQFSKINSKININDNLLIYYAGHGHLDEGEGFWLPINSTLDDESNWISNGFIKRNLKKIKANNILLIADSCFSGTLTRGISYDKDKKMTTKALDLFLKTKSRIAISSGGLKPVLDGGGGNHSVFARMLLNALKLNEEPMTSFDLFYKINKKITDQALAYNVEQSPEIGTIESAGHIGRDFVFFPNSYK